MDFLIKGFILGFSIAAPVGPIGLLCIRKTLHEGRLAGFVSGLGAATADSFYGFISAFGLTAVSSLLLEYQTPIKLLGGLFLIYVAIRIFFSKPATQTKQLTQHTSLGKSYISTLFLTLANPTTILSFIAVFAGLGIVTASHSYRQASAIVIGVFMGSAVWWCILSIGIGFFKNAMNYKKLVWVNRFSGILIGLLGLLSVLSLK